MKSKQFFNFVAMADGHFSSDELEIIRKIEEDLPSIFEKSEESLTRADKEIIVACMCLIASTDNEITFKERDAIEHVAKKLGFDDDKISSYIKVSTHYYSKNKSIKTLATLIRKSYNPRNGSDLVEPPSVPPLDSQTLNINADHLADLRDKKVIEIIDNYTKKAVITMIAVFIPGADIAATCAVWGKMIVEIASVYGHVVKPDDAKALALDIFNVLAKTTAAWFGSAKLATVIIGSTGVGAPAAYLIDAIIASVGLPKLTNKIGIAAAMYYKSNKKIPPSTLGDRLKDYGGPQSLDRKRSADKKAGWL